MLRHYVLRASQRSSFACAFCPARTAFRPFQRRRETFATHRDEPEASSKPQVEKDNRKGVKGKRKKNGSGVAARRVARKSKEIEASGDELNLDGDTSASVEERDGVEDNGKHMRGTTLKDALLRKKRKAPHSFMSGEDLVIERLDPTKLDFKPIEVDRPPVPTLGYGLDRVLFNPGVYHLQDPRSRVYNFDPYLEKIMPVNDFDFDALSEYKTSSQDEDLLKITRDAKAKYTGSTSSMSAVLTHFHFLISHFRNLNLGMLSRRFGVITEGQKQPSKIQKAPTAIFLRYKDGVYAIDADKEFDKPNVMSWLGHSMEKLLTTPSSEFERYRRSNTEEAPPEEEDKKSYHYSQQGDILMRSQLDAHDPRLPGTGIFDLKTRAVVSIRMNASDHEKGAGYQLRYERGLWESYERELFDMMRATMLKYSMQVRMGRMDGIFVAYHNIERIFGFQYLSLADMDFTLHDSTNTHLGDQEFKLSISLLNEMLDRATKKFPGTSIRLHFEARESDVPYMYIFAEPVTEEEADAVQSKKNEATEAFKRKFIDRPGNDAGVQAAWKEIQERVDEEITEDETGQRAQETDEDAAEASAEDGAEDDPEETGIEEVEAEEVVEESVEEGRSTTESSSDEADSLEAGEADYLSATPPPAKPVAGWTLTVRNRVNGEVVSRPDKLTPEDEWTLEYHIQDLDNHNPKKLYDATRKRRQQTLDSEKERDDRNHFRMLIQQYTEQGRAWRAKQDEIDEKLGKRVFKPLGSTSKEENT